MKSLTFGQFPSHRKEEESYSHEFEDTTTVTTVATLTTATTAFTESDFSLPPTANVIVPELLNDASNHVFRKETTRKRPRRKERQNSHNSSYDVDDDDDDDDDNHKWDGNLFSLFYSGPPSKNSQHKHPLRPITMKELQRHNNTEDGCWIVCGTSVYDVTDYIEEHPGGIKSILRRSGSGKDCTRDMKFHSPKAIKLWKSMKIGYLIPSSPSSSPSIQVKQCDLKKENVVSSPNLGQSFFNPFLPANNQVSSKEKEVEFLEETEQCTIS